MNHEFQIYGEGNSGSEHEFQVCADCQMVDNGIGSFEFWGCRGVDRNIEPECDITEVYIVHGDRKRKLESPESLPCYRQLQEQVYKKFETWCNDRDDFDDVENF